MRFWHCSARRRRDRVWFLCRGQKLVDPLIGPVRQRPGSSSKIQKRWQQHALWIERSEGGRPCKRRYVGHFNEKLFRSDRRQPFNFGFVLGDDLGSKFTALLLGCQSVRRLQMRSNL